MFVQNDALPPESALADALGVLASPARLSLLRQLRTPKVLRELEVVGDRPSPDGRPNLISRQAVRDHLERLVEIGVVNARETEREYGPTVEYQLNHQKLFALAEEFRSLARLRPAKEPDGATIHAAPREPFELRGPCLVMVKGLDEGTTFPLRPPAAGKAEWIIGRRRGIPVPLDFDPFVSTENAVIVFEDGSHFLRDLPESRNGTMLNFQLLPKGQRHALHTGDLIGVGRTLLMFRA